MGAEQVGGYKIGIDVGGTFTDFLLMGEGGAGEVFKVLSTPDDPSLAVLEGLGRMAAGAGLELGDFLARVEIIVHGTTVTTNAVLTGNVARTGLLTTRGFRDALAMRRGIREETYDNKAKAPAPLVPRWLRLPVGERINAEGEILEQVAIGDVDQALARFGEDSVEAIAICFMHAYANPANEKKVVAQVARIMPDAYLSTSSEVLPQVRFYDRLSTTVLNAAVGPILRRYLGNLTKRLNDAGFSGLLLIMQSNGGVTSPEAATRLAASTLLSGPAAAPVAGLAYGKLHKDDSFITIDMGGTSFDACLAIDGAPAITTDARIGKLALALPSLEISTIGAGGGSIGWVDEGGLLRMGPASAGAKPGPACYGLGGERPTCSDANLVLGYLNEDYFAGGAMKLDRAAAERAIETHLAQPLGLSLAETAFGMYRIMNVNMASGIREISVQKGYDPRDFPLICAGGAGPVHACMIADELEISRIVIPRESSIFCAAGMLRSDLKHDYVRSYHVEFSQTALDPERFRQALATMEAEAEAALGAETIPAGRRRRRYALDLRYLGQYHEVTVEVGRDSLEGPDFGKISRAFHRAHNRLYGYDLEAGGQALELVNLRLTAIGVTDKPAIPKEPRQTKDAKAALKGHRPVFLPSRMGYAEVAVYDGDALHHGNRIAGPAIVEQVNTSLFVPSDFRLECDAYGSFVLNAQ
ncbi:MAG: hydantoinase/oxoprolinase family protein [Alphaproteobacteria bacterium]